MCASFELVGSDIGRYRIVSLLGRGGMGEVYDAIDSSLGRHIALKVLKCDAVTDRKRLSRFVQEARSASALNHPHLVSIYEIGEHAGVHFIAMEKVDGSTLRQIFSAERLPLPRVLDLTAQITEAVAAAHGAGIVHRDLKPENLMVSRLGYLKVLDFGLAKLHPETGLSAGASGSTLLKATDSGTVLGTVGYMSPEQAQGKEADARSDIFSIGCILYEAIAGRRAFHASSAIDTLHDIIHDEPPPLVQIAPNTPAEVLRIVRKAMAKDPERRYQSAREMAIDLRDAAKVVESVPRRVATPRAPMSSIAFVAMAVALAALLAAYLIRWRERALAHRTGTESHIQSIAVLPLENISRDPEEQYFADSMTEALITDLAKIKALRVVSRTSVMRYKHSSSSVPDIARELNVNALVEGSVERVGRRVRITAQLIDAASDRHLWAESYDRDLGDVLMLQDEVARSIAREIQVKLSPAEGARLARGHRVDPAAYTLYIKGRYFWVKRTQESIDKAITYLHESINKDPSFAAAYSGLADCYSSLGFSFDVGSKAPRDVQPQALAAATKAGELDNSSAEAHSSLGFIKLNYDWDWAAAEAEFKRSIELNPGWANGHHWYAHVLLSAGRFHEAEMESMRALQTDPLSPIMNVHLGWHYFFTRDYDKSLEQLQKTLDLDPQYGLAYWYRGWVYEQKGMFAESLREMRKAQQLLKTNIVVEGDIGHLYAVSGQKREAAKTIAALKKKSADRYVNPFEIALIYVGLQDNTSAFQWLENAYRERSDMLVYLKVDPRLDPIRSDPRFENLVRRVGIPRP